MSKFSEIATKRKELGWSQSKLAKEVGISRRFIVKAEKYPESLELSYFMVRSILNVLEAGMINNKAKAAESQSSRKSL